MIRRFIQSLLIATAVLSLALSGSAHAAQKREFKFAWSIYTGYMPWVYAEKSGILKKWADKYGVKITLVQFNDYIESLNQFTAGQLDGVVGTTIDALALPASAGVDTTVLIMGDYSHGNDAIVVKGKGKSMRDLTGMNVHVVELSVSHFMLARALQLAGMSERDIKVTNVADADFYPAFMTPDVQAIVAWKPGLSSIEAEANTSVVFNSKQIPGELVDIGMVSTQTLKDNPNFGKALVGAWYETLAAMSGPSKTAVAAREFMASVAGTDLADFDSQLATTHLFVKPADAVQFLRSPQLLKGTELMRDFCFQHGLLGKNAASKDAIGIQMPGGKVLGNTANVRLRFDEQYVGLAAAGKL